MSYVFQLSGWKRISSMCICIATHIEIQKSIPEYLFEKCISWVGLAATRTVVWYLVFPLALWSPSHSLHLSFRKRKETFMCTRGRHRVVYNLHLLISTEFHISDVPVLCTKLLKEPTEQTVCLIRAGILYDHHHPTSLKIIWMSLPKKSLTVTLWNRKILGSR